MGQAVSRLGKTPLGERRSRGANKPRSRRLAARPCMPGSLRLHPERTHGIPAVFLTAFHRKPNRSEEHTSELQSRLHLVCRLLLEKKKILKQIYDSESLTMIVSYCM